MRSAALCLLAIAAPACNWAFGIDTTLLADASTAPSEATLPAVRLTWLAAVTDQQGVPALAHLFPGLSPAPTVKYGRIGMPLMDIGIDDEGTIRIPEDYEASTWRLVYQLADGVAREIQWATRAGLIPHVIVPVFGRLDRDPIPGPDTTMVLRPSNDLPAMHMGPIVFTTGVWTQSLQTFGFPSGATFTQNLNQSVQLSGPAGAPDHMKGDQVVLVDYGTSGACRISTGSASFKLALSNGPSTPVSREPFTNTGKSVVVDDAKLTADKVRVGTAASTAIGSVSTVVQLGVSPDPTMPAFTQRGPERVPPLGIRGPLMLPFLDCTNPALSATTPLPTYNLPDALSVFPQTAHIQITADRPAGGLTFTYGIAAVTPIVSGRAAFVIDIAIPSPPFQLGTIDLSTVDDAMVPPGSDPLVLTFVAEPNMTADYYEVILHRVEAGATVVERTYTITAPTLTLDRSVFTQGVKYVFELRAFNGAPDVKLANFTRYLPTQASAVVWTRTFIAN